MRAEDDFRELLVRQEAGVGALRQQFLLAILLAEGDFLFGEVGVARDVGHELEHSRQVLREGAGCQHERIRG